MQPYPDPGNTVGFNQIKPATPADIPDSNNIYTTRVSDSSVGLGYSSYYPAGGYVSFKIQCIKTQTGGDTGTPYFFTGPYRLVAYPNTPYVVAQKLNTTTLFLDWSKDALGNGYIASPAPFFPNHQYVIHIGTTPDLTTYTEINSTLASGWDSPPTSSLQYYLSTGLTYGTTYYLVVYADNTVVYSTGSNLVTVLWAFAPGAPSGVNLIPVDRYSFTIDWTDSTFTGGINASSYDIVCVDTGGTDSHTFAFQNKTAGVRLKISTLFIAGRNYTCQVAARNTVNLGAWSSSSPSTLLAVPPDAPTNLTASQLSTTQTQLDYVPGLAAGSAVLFNRIDYSTDSGFASYSSVNSTTSSANLPLSVSPNPYYIRVLSYSAVGYSTASNTLSFTVQGKPVITSGSLTSASFSFTGTTVHNVLENSTLTNDNVTFSGVGFKRFPGGTTITYTDASMAQVYTCTPTVPVTDTSITCSLNGGVGKNLYFQVTSGTTASDLSQDSISFPVPTIASKTLRRPDGTIYTLLPASSTTSEIVYFNGTNFGSIPNYVVVRYGPSSNPNLYACTVVTISDTVLSCLTAPRPANPAASDIRDLKFNIQVGLGVGAQSASGSDIYNYPIAPIITNITGCAPCPAPYLGTCNCTTTGGTNVTVTGQYLSEPLTILIQGSPCTPVIFSPPNTTSVTCTIPEANGGFSLPVVATQLTFSSSPVNFVSYAIPTLNSAIGCPANESASNPQPTNCSRTAMPLVTINGDNFGKTGARGFVGGVPCVSTNVTIPHHQVICELPQGFGQNQVINIYQLGGNPSVGRNVYINYLPCDPGTFQNGTDCPSCPNGTSNSLPGQLVCIICSPGYFGNTSGLVQCYPCEGGSFQPGNGNTSCIPCLPGFSNNATTQAFCPSCEAGRYSNTSGNLNCTQCPVGKSQPVPQQLQCIACDPGYSQDSLGQAFCKPCKPGYFSNITGLSDCYACEPGKSQSQGNATSCDPCLPGTHSVGFECDPCTAGSFSNQSLQQNCTLCPVGTFQKFSHATNCTPCDVGQYANGTGSEFCLTCPPGKYQNLTGQQDCIPCAAGYNQSAPGSLSCAPCLPGLAAGPGSLFCIPCAPGSYSNATAASCTQCPNGLFQENFYGTSCDECPAGKITNDNRQGCQNCTAGRFAAGTASVNCTLCSPGTYTDLPGQQQCKNCSGGEFANFEAATRCFDCIAGTYSTPGAELCSSCEPGYATNQSKAQSCDPCAAGTFGILGSTKCVLCPQGKFSNATAGECTNCTEGTYTDSDGRTSCDSCAPGKSAAENSADCALCTPGFFAPDNASASCLTCQPGYYSDYFSKDCRLCAGGAYNNITGSSNCTRCQAGFYAPNPTRASPPIPNIQCFVCPDNLWSGEGASGCGICGEGLVSNADHTGCLHTYHETEAVKFFFLVLSLAGLGTIMFTFFAFVYWRENRIINYSSPPLMYVILVGFAILWVSVILWIWDQTDAMCHFRNILLNIGCDLVIVTLMAKTFRLHRIFNRSKKDALETVRITNYHLAFVISLFVLYDIIILAAWWGVAPFSVDPHIFKCLSKAEPWIHVPLWWWKPALLLFLAYLAYEIREIDSRFNESWWIGVAIYNGTVTIGLLAILTYTLNLIPRNWFIMFCTIIAYLTLSTWALIFLPKFYFMYKKNHENEELFGAEIASEINEAQEVVEDEQKDEAKEEQEKKKGISPSLGDDALDKLDNRRNKKAKELQKLLKIVDRTKQRMKSDITAMNTLSGDVMALQQEIEYRKRMLKKKGIVVTNKSKTPEQLELSGGINSGPSLDYVAVSSPATSTATDYRQSKAELTTGAPAKSDEYGADAESGRGEHAFEG